MRIDINYNTGNSFGQSLNEKELLAYDFNTYELAKEALKRIEEHYKWYSDKNSSWAWSSEKTPRPSWHKIKTKGLGNTDSMINLRVWSEKNNKIVEVEFWPFWIGYFETLNYAEIVGERFTV